MTVDPPARRPGSEVSGARGSIQLVVFAGDAVELHSLPPSGSLSIGRASENDIWINHPSVSRRHAMLHLDPQLRIEDLGGANGTFMRDGRVPESTGETLGIKQLSGQAMEIALGDCITFGTVTAVVRRTPDGIGPAAASDAPCSVSPASDGVIAQGPAMVALYEQARLAARSLISVLILGETGAGKEVLARAIHDASPRAQRSFLGLNCAALSESVLESELFGHEKGSFTGATQARPGLFEAAGGGTVFLDEVGDLPMSIQVKLLRVLEERQVLRVGARTPQRIDVRFLAATNKNLDAEIERGTFREDLFFRLNGITLTIPPLRERVTEIAPLARIFMVNACAQIDRPHPLSISGEVLALLERYRWPGNVRELRNVVDRAVVLCAGDTLKPEHLPAKITAEAVSTPLPHAPTAGAVPAVRAAPAQPPIEEEMNERERIILALETCAGNQTQAAAKLGISRSTLIARIETYDLPRPRRKS